jgi:hypothetical protein
MQLARYPRLTGLAMALWLAWGCWSGTPAVAQDDEQATASIEPDLPQDITIEFSRLTPTEGGDYEFIGPVTITWRESRIQADRVRLSEKRYIEAEGNVLIAWADSHIFGTRMEYDLETEQGVIENASGMVENEYLFWAKKAEKIGPERVRLKSARVTSCTQPNPYWSFNVSSAVITLNAYARMWNVVLRGGKVPFFYLPYLIWPVKEDRAIGLLMPEFQSTANRGHAFSQELFIPLGKSADLTLLGRYYTKAGFGGGGEFRIVPNARGVAKFTGFYIDDQVDNAERYAVSYKQTQEFRNGFRMVADINKVSDFDFFTDYARDLTLITSPTILARLEFSRNSSWTSLNVRELRREQLFSDSSSLVQQSLPEVEWRGRSRRLGRTPLYLEFESSLASIQQREVDRPAPIDADYYRADLFPTLSLPWAPVGWLDINPLARFRWTYYTQHQRELAGPPDTPNTREVVDDPLSRQLFSAGLEIIGPKLYRVFERPDKPGSTRYKHAIETHFVWGYAEPFDRTNDIIPFDEVDRVSGSGNQINYALVQRLFAQRPRARAPEISAGRDVVMLPDGTTSRPDEPFDVGAGLGPPPAEEPDEDAPREPVEIANLELRQTRSFDRNLSFADLDNDGVTDATSPYSDVAIIGRYNPSPVTSLDLRSNYHILYNKIGNVTLSGGLRRRVVQARFSLVHRVGLGVRYDPVTGGFADVPDNTQARVTTGLNMLRGKLRLDLDGSFVFSPPEGQSAIPDWRWRVNYATQCCTFVFEQLRRDFAASDSKRDDFYFRVDFKGIGKVLAINY